MKKVNEIMRFLIPCWERQSMDRFSRLGNCISINFLLAFYLVIPGSLFNMGPSFLFSRVVSILRIDEYLTLSFLMHGNLAVFHRLMKYVDPMAMAQVHPSIKTYS